ncbi:MAG: Asp-tRNA(Asn)/Glu-tRNA(Gln) amidotransferase subunit GatC [Cyanobacteria bacterium P01_A01_bin.135]
MLDREQVKKVAYLARLALTEEEEVKFTAQLGDILDYVQQLDELDTADVSPTTRAIDVSNVTRADVQETSLQRETMLESAPERDDEYFKVPKIM